MYCELPADTECPDVVVARTVVQQLHEWKAKYHDRPFFAGLGIRALRRRFLRAAAACVESATLSPWRARRQATLAVGGTKAVLRPLPRRILTPPRAAQARTTRHAPGCVPPLPVGAVPVELLAECAGRGCARWLRSTWVLRSCLVCRLLARHGSGRTGGNRAGQHHSCVAFVGPRLATVGVPNS